MVILKVPIRSADEWRELPPSEKVTDPLFVPTTDDLEAGQQVILEVSSNLLTNKVLIRGAYLLSRSSGVNRIKGGSVQIN